MLQRIALEGSEVPHFLRFSADGRYLAARSPTAAACGSTIATATGSKRFATSTRAKVTGRHSRRTAAWRPRRKVQTELFDSTTETFGSSTRPSRRAASLPEASLSVPTGDSWRSATRTSRTLTFWTESSSPSFPVRKNPVRPLAQRTGTSRLVAGWTHAVCGRRRRHGPQRSAGVGSGGKRRRAEAGVLQPNNGSRVEHSAGRPHSCGFDGAVPRLDERRRKGRLDRTVADRQLR